MEITVGEKDWQAVVMQLTNENINLRIEGLGSDKAVHGFGR